MSYDTERRPLPDILKAQLDPSGRTVLDAIRKRDADRRKAEREQTQASQR